MIRGGVRPTEKYTLDTYYGTPLGSCLGNDKWQLKKELCHHAAAFNVKHNQHSSKQFIYLLTSSLRSVPFHPMLTNGGTGVHMGEIDVLNSMT